EARAHRGRIRVCERGPLDVDALAEADVRLQVGECTNVFQGAPQVRLQHDADVVVPRLAQLAVQAQRRVGGRRILHVDAYEAPLREHLEHVLLAQLVRELET